MPQHANDYCEKLSYCIPKFYTDNPFLSYSKYPINMIV